MPVGPDYYDAVVNAVVGTLPAGATVRLYSALADPVAGPDPADELPADGGYAPASVTAGDFSASTGGDGLATATVDFGTATDEWPETALAWAVEDTGGGFWHFDLLRRRVDVDAAGPVTAQLDIYLRSVD